MSLRNSRIASIGSPAAWLLALVLCFLPFLSVSCDAPGGFGRMEAGGTTSWSAADLAIGSAPSVDADHVRPEAEQQSDDLGWQPLVALGVVALGVGIVLAASRRWLAATVSGFVAAVALIVGELVARASLVDLVATQATEPFEPGKSASDHVAIGIGFWSSIIVVLVGCAFALIGTRTSAAGILSPDE